ncbi:AfsR/SARP family transcriptional regulator [Streptomyces sp. DSM 15324]|uniref:AfsR/SARP family transcriptional regulator n=1 Tax=Streptomyces sp. DSM 15324 TaxID=1739111 RepID=UPI001F41E426|nr:BTAD domain-containing putative transcriptional regulator [Streptomyces sp. DSM 15324]
MIRAAGDGYQLTSPGELDLSVFRELFARAERARGAGDAQGAATCLGDALALWRGAALAGIRGEYADSQRQRLNESSGGRADRRPSPGPVQGRQGGHGGPGSPTACGRCRVRSDAGPPWSSPRHGRRSARRPWGPRPG